MQLFKGDAYIVIIADGERYDLASVDPVTSRRLAVQFNTMATDTSQPDTGEVTIFNLSETTRNAISKAQESEIFLHAGYPDAQNTADSIPQIAQGDIYAATHRKEGTEWRTLIRWGDGQRAYETARFNKSFRAGASVSDVIGDVVASMGLALGDVGQLLGGLTTAGGLSLDGKSKDVLDTLTADQGVQWTIDENTIYFRETGQPIDTVAIVLNAQSGLLDHPAVTEKGADFIVQINPDIQPGTLVELEPISTDTTVGGAKGDAAPGTGLYIVKVAKYQGDNFGGAFEIKCEGVSADV